MMRIGVDLGGTKIEAIALDPAGRALARRRIATPAHDYAQTIDAVRGLVESLEAELGGTRARVGVGAPGAISSRSGLVKNANSTQLNGRPLADDLALALGREVRVENDANCFALSEASDGAGAGRRLVFGVILGTGVGGGIVVDGRLWVGANAIAGEWGHNEMPSRGAPGLPDTRCYCGRARCIETFVSGPGLVADHRREAPHASPDLDAAAVVALAHAGDAAACAAMARFYDRLAGALATVINVLDPDVVVLGGGLSNIEPLCAEVAARLPAHVFSDAVTTPVVRNRHGDSSGVRGAAWLWPP
jgi:predicted NBD/HSP70 family sugar kinase